MAENGKGLSDGDSANSVVATFIVVFISMALYNVLELNFVIFGTFKKRSGLYFWSFLIATWGIAPNAIGYLLKHLALTNISNLPATLIVTGWCTMVTGQSVVLYSRLRLLSPNPTILRAVLIIIIFNGIVLHVPVIILVYGSSSSNPGPFIRPYSVYEKLQLTVFFIQETIISGLYIWEATKLLKAERDIRGRAGPKRVMNHLIYVNIIVILLDVTIVALEFANYYDVQTGYKPLVYSIKLKMEFSILNRLVELTQSSTHSSSYTCGRTDATAGVALDTFAADGTSCSRGITWRRSDEAHIGSGGNDRDLERSATGAMRTTEPRPGRNGELESLNGKTDTMRCM
ncbi:Hypothetical protein NCS54_00002800 [Fusarium falciforme]|uniref:Hypothetical protein n=1 Tax=Fusarium falciforme TaxID=195108 RepID=UPI0023017EB1|nr:Hypothetical protein NCS54_00002800 [Fusarium falciforme]WAO82858.1 Hypothetical protein NCS54_00002800 [Fusarium falciforme]